MIDKSCSNAT